jgi:hypothetical protein
MNEVICPGIVTKLVEVSRRLADVPADKERLCYLVTDREWQEVIDYSSLFMECARPDIGVATMRFAGLEVIKRSSLLQSEGIKL